jgi:Multicopper oxidase
MDMVMLGPMMTVVADMVPDNPGTWLFHCHLPGHFSAGMRTLFEVAPWAPDLHGNGILGSLPCGLVLTSETRGGLRKEESLSRILELLETAVLPNGFRQSGRRSPSNGLGGLLERQDFWRARSNEVTDENAVATFAYRITLNVRGLQGIRTISDSWFASIRVLCTPKKNSHEMASKKGNVKIKRKLGRPQIIEKLAHQSGQLSQL